MFEVITALLALLMLVAIAFPHLCNPKLGLKKSVTSSYWGRYEDSTPDGEDEKTIKCPEPARAQHTLGGSAQYATSKGLARR